MEVLAPLAAAISTLVFANEYASTDRIRALGIPPPLTCFVMT